VVRLQRAYRRRLGHLAVMSTINERINDRVDLQNLVERRQKELDAVSLRQQQEAYEIEEQQIVDANESVFRESVIFVGGETKNEEQQDSWNELQAANANLRSENEELKQTIEQRDEKIVELEIKLQETPGNEMSRTNVQSIIKNFDFDIASMYVDENN
jgi:aspartyl/asparaginyl-tRNA synthetase